LKERSHSPDEIDKEDKEIMDDLNESINEIKSKFYFEEVIL